MADEFGAGVSAGGEVSTGAAPDAGGGAPDTPVAPARASVPAPGTSQEVTPTREQRQGEKGRILNREPTRSKLIESIRAEMAGKGKQVGDDGATATTGERAVAPQPGEAAPRGDAGPAATASVLSPLAIQMARQLGLMDTEANALGEHGIQRQFNHVQSLLRRAAPQTPPAVVNPAAPTQAPAQASFNGTTPAQQALYEAFRIADPNAFDEHGQALVGHINKTFETLFQQLGQPQQLPQEVIQMKQQLDGFLAQQRQAENDRQWHEYDKLLDGRDAEFYGTTDELRKAQLPGVHHTRREQLAQRVEALRQVMPGLSLEQAVHQAEVSMFPDRAEARITRQIAEKAKAGRQGTTLPASGQSRSANGQFKKGREQAVAAVANRMQELGMRQDW